MEKFEFSGVSGIPKNIDESEIEWVSENCVVLNEVFEHLDDDFSFKYQYAVNWYDVYDSTDDEDNEKEKYYFDLYLVVHRDSLSEKVKNSILNGDEFEINAYDVIADGIGVEMGSDLFRVNDDEIEDIALKILGFVHVFNGLRGFYLDKAWNMIGTCGWDNVRYSIGEQEKLINW